MTMDNWIKLSPKLVMQVFNKSAGRCWYCGVLLTWEGRKLDAGVSVSQNTFVTDHLIARINGGSDKLGNLVPCCWSCNSRKRSRSLEDFRELETRLSNNAPKFTDEQLFYLKRVGIQLPVYEPYEFYFEKAGLE